MTSFFRGGRFLERRRLPRPGSSSIDHSSPEYYGLEHFYIGSQLEVFGRRFRLTGADEAVLRYMEQEDIHLPDICRASLVQLHREKEEEAERRRRRQEETGEKEEKREKITVPVA